MIPGSAAGHKLRVSPQVAAPTLTTQFFDDFKGPANSQPDPTVWTYDTGRWGASNGEQEYYTSGANCYVDGSSNLVLVARNETTPDNQVPPSTTAYTSARLTTKGLKTFRPPCRVAARIKVPYTKGLWPAFWMVGDSTKASANYTAWPAVGEIDIAEWVNSKYNFNGHVHLGQVGALSTNVGLQSYAIADPRTFTNQYSIHGIDWYTDRILWHVDGVVVGSITQSQAAAANADWTPLGSSGWPFYLLLNIAIGSTTWAAVGQPDGTSSFPQSMLVDWVGVWGI